MKGGFLTSCKGQSFVNIDLQKVQMHSKVVPINLIKAHCVLLGICKDGMPLVDLWQYWYEIYSKLQPNLTMT